MRVLPQGAHVLTSSFCFQLLVQHQHQFLSTHMFMCHSCKQLLIELPGNNYPIAEISSSESLTMKQEGNVPFLVP